jgi:hypothetical protein
VNGNWFEHGSTTTPGPIGQSLSFDGINDYVGTSSSPGSIASVQSVAFWIRIATSTAMQKVMNLNGQGTIRVNTNASGQLIVTGLAGSEIMYLDGVATTTAAASSAVNTDWHHVVITTGTGFTANNITVGRVLTQYFGGALDDVRLYTRLLSPAEALRLYQMGATTRVGIAIPPRGVNSTQQTDLIGWWTMNGPDINLALPTAEVGDRSGQGVNGDWKNHATTTAPGAIGQAINFDGTDDYIDLGSNFSFQPTGTPFSVSAWVYTNEGTLTKGIVSRRSAAGAGWEVSISTSEQINLAIGDTGSTKYFISTTGIAAIPLGKWTHIAATYDGTNANGMHIYINGVEKVSTVGDNDSAGSITYTNNAMIGSTLGGNYMNGSIDDVRIYNRVLSTDEIKRLYEMGK